MASDDLERQAEQYRARQDEWLGKGKCPDSGEEMVPEMDTWCRRVLMCEMCDCFGYPLVVSDIPSDKYNYYDQAETRKKFANVDPEW